LEIAFPLSVMTLQEMYDKLPGLLGKDIYSQLSKNQAVLNNPEAADMTVLSFQFASLDELHQSVTVFIKMFQKYIAHNIVALSQGVALIGNNVVIPVVCDNNPMFLEPIRKEFDVLMGGKLLSGHHPFFSCLVALNLSDFKWEMRGKVWEKLKPFENQRQEFVSSLVFKGTLKNNKFRYVVPFGDEFSSEVRNGMKAVLSQKIVADKKSDSPLVKRPFKKKPENPHCQKKNKSYKNDQNKKRKLFKKIEKEYPVFTEKELQNAQSIQLFKGWVGVLQSSINHNLIENSRLKMIRRKEKLYLICARHVVCTEQGDPVCLIIDTKFAKEGLQLLKKDSSRCKRFDDPEEILEDSLKNFRITFFEGDESVRMFYVEGKGKGMLYINKDLVLFKDRKKTLPAFRPEKIDVPSLFALSVAA
jgi:hypothetical protein